LSKRIGDAGTGIGGEVRIVGGRIVRQVAKGRSQPGATAAGAQPASSRQGGPSALQRRKPSLAIDVATDAGSILEERRDRSPEEQLEDM